MPAGRPRLKAGSFGEISTKQLDKGKWQARVLYRDNAGKRREAMKIGTTKAGAGNVLKDFMVNQILPTLEAGAVARTTTIADLARMYLEAKTKAGRSPGTLDTYRGAIEGTIIPKIGELSVVDATAMRLQEFIHLVSRKNGPGAAKSCRSVLSGMMQMAVVNDVVKHNPVRSLERIKQKEGHRGATALKPDELQRMRKVVTTDKELIFRDIADLWEFMSYVGCRIGEALALRDTMIDDVEAGLITLGPSVSRIKGQGLVVYEPGKTASEDSIGWRTIVIPKRAAEIVRSRMGHPSGLIFCSMEGHLRDPNNTERDWRNNRLRLGFPTFTSHGFRKTIATILDEAGLSARDIADYLGHKNPSMTQDVYMAKNTQTARVANILTTT